MLLRAHCLAVPARAQCALRAFGSDGDVGLHVPASLARAQEFIVAVESLG